MKGFQFYAVMPTERKSKSASKSYPFNPFTRARLTEIAAQGGRNECLALHVENINGHSWRYNPGAACQALDNVPGSVGYSGVSLEYLRTRCVRISEAMARELHPELITYLEYEPA